ncbi:MAG TPA: Crp/Fnr family transcriptional regulator [Caulobacter sp.]|nr:Crp/Fnr family transcriptional regulator [Caulobacter sp.]
MSCITAPATALAVVRNSLLTGCSSEFFSALAGIGARTTYEPGATPWRAGETILFPESGLISLRTLSVDGGEIEVGMVSSEGAVGLLQAFGGGIPRFEARVLTPTIAWSVSATAFPALARADDAVMKRLWVYLAEAEAETHAIASCGLTHGARERLADILRSYDRRQGGERLYLTQETLSASVGVCRTTVTALMTDLTAADAIRAGRGWFAVTDPGRLAAAGCGCRNPETRR